MAYMVQKGSLKLNGKRYEPGDIVPDEGVTARLVRSGRILTVPDVAVDQLAGGAGMYDPGQRTVTQVLEYVKGHPEKAQEIYDAEVAGGGRVTLLTPLEELIAAQDAPSDDASGALTGEATGQARTEVPGDTLTGYDPANYTITEVLAYANTNPGTLLELGKAERAGKNRQTLLEELGRRLSAQTTPTA